MQVVVLFVVGIVALVGSVFLYTNQENNDFKKFTESVNQAKSSYEQAEKKTAEYDTKLQQAIQACQNTTGLIDQTRRDLDSKIEDHKSNLEKLKQEFGVIEVRQRTMEKKQLLSKRELLMTFGDGKPLPIQIIRRQPTTTQPTPLLDKVGITGGQKKAQPQKAQ